MGMYYLSIIILIFIGIVFLYKVGKNIITISSKSCEDAIEKLTNFKKLLEIFYKNPTEETFNSVFDEIPKTDPYCDLSHIKINNVKQNLTTWCLELKSILLSPKNEYIKKNLIEPLWFSQEQVDYLESLMGSTEAEKLYLVLRQELTKKIMNYVNHKTNWNEMNDSYIEQIKVGFIYYIKSPLKPFVKQVMDLDKIQKTSFFKVLVIIGVLYSAYCGINFIINWVVNIVIPWCNQF